MTGVRDFADTSVPTAADEDPASDATHLDTSFLIHALVPGTPEDRRLRQWILRGTTIAMSSVAWAEFLCGPVSDQDRQRAGTVIGTPLPLVGADAARAASLFNAGGRRRGTLSDCLIAATAVEANATLATSNPDDFQRFTSQGLKLASV